MNRQANLTGLLLILSAVTFWISWFLMPDPGTVDTIHILNIVKENRMAVLCSVIIQIVSSMLYVVSAIFLSPAYLSWQDSDGRRRSAGDRHIGALLRCFFSFTCLVYDGQLCNYTGRCDKSDGFHANRRGSFSYFRFYCHFLPGTLYLQLG